MCQFFERVAAKQAPRHDLRDSAVVVKRRHDGLLFGSGIAGVTTLRIPDESAVRDSRACSRAPIWPESASAIPRLDGAWHRANIRFRSGAAGAGDLMGEPNMGEGMARIVALGAGALLAGSIVIIFGAGRLNNWLALAIGSVVGIALYLLLTWN